MKGGGFSEAPAVWYQVLFCLRFVIHEVRPKKNFRLIWQKIPHPLEKTPREVSFLNCGIMWNVGGNSYLSSPIDQM